MTFEEATQAHCQALAPVMRPADVAELHAAGFDSPLEALTQAVAVSNFACAALFDGEVGALLGVAGDGVVWLLSGHAVDRHPMAFLSRSRWVLGLLLQGRARLYNFVDVRHTQAIRWLKWLGFEVAAQPVPHGPYDMPFLPFQMKGV